MNIERPLDLLNNAKGHEIIITLRNGDKLGEEEKVILLAFDLHINLSVEMPDRHRFIKGDDVVWVDKKKGGESG